MEIPKNVDRVLKRLKKNDIELGEDLIERIAKDLKESGHTDARTWTASILPMVLGELKYVESSGDMEEWLLALEGIERDVVESLYDNFDSLAGKLKGTNPQDVKDAVIYSVSKALDTLDKEKYRKLYG